MNLALNLAKVPAKNTPIVYLVKKSKSVSEVSETLKAALVSGLKTGQSMIHFVENDSIQTILPIDAKTKEAGDREAIRNSGFSLLQWLNQQKVKAVSVVNLTGDSEVALLLTEGMALGNYSFTELSPKKKKDDQRLEKLNLIDAKLTSEALKRVQTICECVCFSRDLVNRPLSHLNAEGLAEAVSQSGKSAGFKVEVLNKQKITALKMGGLLSVNKGSIDPPTFSIAEYKPKGAVNKKPLILVGKGVVYDTGGMSLKPTPNSMDFMKSDMAGAAVMIGAIRAIAALKYPVHVIALIPATDNRVDGNACVPGDVITMFDGTTVEVKNTDAEGRLLLADALSYAKKYDPELVIDAATLTGASVRAIGTYATSIMGTASDKVLNTFDAAGQDTYERVVRFPLWKEYGDELKSEVADMSNLGKGEGGQISAGKFLEHFTDYPWVHLDIAGPSFLHAPATYRLTGGTAAGVRLLVSFIEKHYNL